MANEEDVVIWSRQIAEAIAEARVAMEAAADGTGELELDARLGRRLEDVGMLSESVDRVREVEAQGRATADASYTGGELRAAFQSSQQTAGVAVDRISTVREELGEHREELTKASDALDRGLGDLKRLEELPGRKTPETQQLRARLDNLKAAVTTAGAGIDRALGQVGSARSAVSDLEVAELGIDPSGQHSAAIEAAREQATTDLGAAQEGMRSVHEALARTVYGEENVVETAYKSEDLANAAETALNSDDLATATRVGLNPPLSPGQARAAGSAEQAHRTGATGPAHRKELDL